MLVETGANIGGAISMAKSITLLEHYNGDGCLNALYNSRGVQTKMRDLNVNVSSVRREVLKFFSKRTSCSCLKEMHREARKSISKMGLCFGCAEEKERVALSVCSRCMIHQYCSRECQVAAWPSHEKDCNNLANSHKQLIKEKRENAGRGT